MTNLNIVEETIADEETLVAQQNAEAAASTIVDNETLKANAHQLIIDANSAGIDIFNLIGLVLTEAKNAS